MWAESGCYIIEFTGTEYNYIGQSVNMRQRISQHLGPLRKGKHRNTKMQAVFNKYGESAFTWKPLLCCPPEELDRHEDRLIKQRWGDQYFMNQAPHAGTRRGVLASAETCKKNSAHAKAMWQDPDYRAKQTALKVARAQDPVWLAKMSVAASKHPVLATHLDGTQLEFISIAAVLRHFNMTSAAGIKTLIKSNKPSKGPKTNGWSFAYNHGGI